MRTKLSYVSYLHGKQEEITCWIVDRDGNLLEEKTVGGSHKTLFTYGQNRDCIIAGRRDNDIFTLAICCSDTKKILAAINLIKVKFRDLRLMYLDCDKSSGYYPRVVDIIERSFDVSKEIEL